MNDLSGREDRQLCSIDNHELQEQVLDNIKLDQMNIRYEFTTLLPDAISSLLQIAAGNNRATLS